jgi:3-methylcrotonyl-CoA carboxylase alpha subunit
VPTAEAPPFQRLLIANRGEIAVRVIRACTVLGIRSIAVYSDADREALHVRLADEAHPIGSGSAAESYLHVERILEVAQTSGAQAVHPGYGFLSENAAFAEACAGAGLAFVGPAPEAMRLLGDKAAARRLAAAHGVPIVPGYDGSAQDDTTLSAEASRIGWPLLVKAAAGGGGRGMRVAASPDVLPDALAAARREARAAFGDDTLILERLVTGVRHVEVQILGDQHGGLIHLGERDCSVQRRHQKVIEESPGPGISPELRDSLGEAALRVARAAGYVGAGTCEFLVSQDSSFWFIEMNARLQVEHPVTEEVTGIDLVRAQLEIAAGKPVRWRQEEIALRGHAIECRLYAEDPARNDLPAPGRLSRFQPPDGPGLRHEIGYTDGDRVPPYYDTMLAKLIATGPDRATAIQRARAALDQYEIAGLPTNRVLLAWTLDHPTFQAGAVTTEFLEAERPALDAAPDAPPGALAAGVAFYLTPSTHGGDLTPPDWRIAGQGVITFWLVSTDRTPLAVVADRDGHRRWLVTASGERFMVSVSGLAGMVLVRPADDSTAAPTRYRVTVDAPGQSIQVEEGDGGSPRYHIRRAPPPGAGETGVRHATTGAHTLEAPMPGRVVRIAVSVGETVREHQPLVIVEAMKIEQVVAAPRDGIVSAIRCAEGEAVAGGQVLVELASS